MNAEDVAVAGNSLAVAVSTAKCWFALLVYSSCYLLYFEALKPTRSASWAAGKRRRWWGGNNSEGNADCIYSVAPAVRATILTAEISEELQRPAVQLRKGAFRPWSERRDVKVRCNQISETLKKWNLMLSIKLQLDIWKMSGDLRLTKDLFLWSISVIYLFAFASLFVQIPGWCFTVQVF